MTRKSETYDAIVVGSGIAGGWAAKELAERGLRVCLLEAGRHTTPAKDYTSNVPEWELRLRGLVGEDAKAAAPVQSRHPVWNEYNRQFFVEDKDHPYTTAPGAEALWIRGRQLGGRSLVWGRQSYRVPDLCFEANEREGSGPDWPIRYRDLEPWYAHVERHAGISGNRDGLAQVPDGEYLPAMAMNCAELVVKERVEKRYPERHVIIGRTANLTKPMPGRGACRYCDKCDRGCFTNSYFSSLSSTLPSAMATKRLTIRANSIVHSLRMNSQTRRATGVHVIDRETKHSSTISARLVFLCAGAMETLRILMNSKGPGFSSGVGNGAGQLGLRVMDHVSGVYGLGTLPGLEKKTVRGRRPTPIIIPRFQNLSAERTEPFARGYWLQGVAYRQAWGRLAVGPGVGAELKDGLGKAGPWQVFFMAFGEWLPDPANRVSLDSDLRDSWGIPVLRFQTKLGPNELQMQKHMVKTMQETMDAAGARDVTVLQLPSPFGLAIHEMGGAPMGKSPKNSVLNGWNQLHEVGNVFVTDGAAMASSTSVHPSLTYMALSARAAAHAVNLLQRREL